MKGKSKAFKSCLRCVDDRDSWKLLTKQTPTLSNLVLLILIGQQDKVYHIVAEYRLLKAEAIPMRRTDAFGQGRDDLSSVSFFFSDPSSMELEPLCVFRTSSI